jgi:D-glycero-alpha-D-manno-heptose 1-phosphate guanylyltransferase
MGTRLREAIGETPKCLALVNGLPFLHYQIEYLKSQGVSKFIFSVGYKSEMIISYIQKEYSNLNYKFSVEIQPLGTGGAIKKALGYSESQYPLVVNGDTFFNINLDRLYSISLLNSFPFTVALFKISENTRYGYVTISEDQRITQFNEKKEAINVLVNSGFYLIDKTQISFLKYSEIFSLEKEYFANAIKDNLLYSVVFESDFIDIGIPQDYIISQTFFKNANKIV